MFKRSSMIAFIALLISGSIGCNSKPENTTGKVTGTVAYLQSVALPPDAELNVRLEDISLQDAPAGLIAEKTIALKNKPAPFAFAIEYDASVIEESHSYSVRAEIRVGGEPKFISTQSYPVLTREAPNHVDVIVMALQSQAPANSPLIGTHWSLVELGGRAVAKTPTGREPHLMLLEEENRAVATGGCNQMSGTYRLSSDMDGTKLAFSQFAATMKACPDGMDRDQALGQALQKTAGCRVDGSNMEILDASGAVLARFHAASMEE